MRCCSAVAAHEDCVIHRQVWGGDCLKSWSVLLCVCLIGRLLLLLLLSLWLLPAFLCCDDVVASPVTALLLVTLCC